MVVDADPGIPSHVSGKQDGGPALLGSWYGHRRQLLGCAYFDKVNCIAASWRKSISSNDVTK